MKKLTLVMLFLSIVFPSLLVAQNAPVIETFKATPSLIAVSEKSKLEWQTSGADSVAIFWSGSPLIILPASGSWETDNLYQTRTFTLRTYAQGQSAQLQIVTVSVAQTGVNETPANSADEKGTVRIYNLNGQVVDQYAVESILAQQKHKSLPAGLYIQEIIGSSGKIYRSKLMIL